MNLNSKFALLDHVSLTEVDGESVLLDLNSGAYFGLNHVGTQILNGFSDQQGLPIALQDIAKKYNTSPAQVQQDASELLEQLLQQGLISVEPNE